MASNTNTQRTTSLNKDNTDTDAWGPQNIAEFNRWFISAITTSDLLKQLADKPQWVAHIRYIITSGEPQKKTPQKKAAAIPAKDDDVWKAIPMKSIMKPFYADPALFVDRVVTNWVNSLDLKSWKITDGKGNLVIVDDDRIKNVSRHAHNLVRGIRHKLRSQICDAAWNYPWGPPTERIQRANFGDYFKTEEGKDQLLIWIATTVLESTPNEAGKAKVSGNLLTFVQENLIRFSSMASHDTAKKALAETKDKEFKNAVSATIEDVQMISDSVSVASHATDQVDEPSAAPFEEPSSIAEEQPPPKTNKKTTKASKKRKRGDSPKKHNTRSSPTKRGRPAKK